MGPTIIYNGVEEGRDITAPLCVTLSVIVQFSTTRKTRGLAV